MVNCWGLLLTDTPRLKVMSTECTSGSIYRTEISVNQLVHSLRRRQSLTSLSFTNCYIIPHPTMDPSPVSMEKLKEVVLRRMDSEVLSSYIRCPSMGTVTTLRIAPFNRGNWVDGWTVSFTATNGLGDSVSSLVYLTSDTSLRVTWYAISPAFQHAITTLEVEDLHLIANGVTAIPKLIEVLPDLSTIRARVPPVAEGFEILHQILLGRCGITRVERLGYEMESPDEARRSDEEWKALCAVHKIHDLLA